MPIKSWALSWNKVLYIELGLPITLYFCCRDNVVFNVVHYFVSVFFSSAFITAEMSAFSKRKICLDIGVDSPELSGELKAAVGLVWDDPLYLYLRRFITINPYTQSSDFRNTPRAALPQHLLTLNKTEALKLKVSYSIVIFVKAKLDKSKK